mgnify:CR=1 FL=1
MSARSITTTAKTAPSNATHTYRRLTGLSVFERVDIAYDTTGLSRSAMADAHIKTHEQS